jgi:hypothetical protein
MKILKNLFNNVIWVLAVLFLVGLAIYYLGYWDLFNIPALLPFVFIALLYTGLVAIGSVILFPDFNFDKYLSDAAYAENIPGYIMVAYLVSIAYLFGIYLTSTYPFALKAFQYFKDLQ